ncbi:hypothetical protein Tco_0241175 [Tanacetum coccineum]
MLPNTSLLLVQGDTSSLPTCNTAYVVFSRNVLHMSHTASNPKLCNLATLKLQAEFDEEERLAREKDEKEKEANIALIETWDDIHVNINADHQLAERLQAQEQE